MNNNVAGSRIDTIDTGPIQPFTAPQYESKRWPYNPHDTISSGQPTPEAVETENVEATEQKAKKSWLYSFFEPLINFLWKTPQPVAETNVVAATESQTASLGSPKLRRPQDIDPNTRLHIKKMSELLERMENMEQEEIMHDHDVLIQKLLIEAFHERRTSNELKQEESMDEVLFYSKFLSNLQAEMSKVWSDKITNSKYAKILNITGNVTTVTTISLTAFSCIYLAASAATLGALPMPVHPSAALPAWLLITKTSAAFTKGLTLFGKGFVDKSIQENAAMKFTTNEKKGRNTAPYQGID